MRHGKFSIDKSNQDFQLVDHETGQVIIFDRASARFFFVWLMNRLNVQSAVLCDGREITAMRYFEEIKRFLNESDKNSEV